MQIIENKQLVKPDRRQVLTRIGYEEHFEPPRRIRSLVEDYIDNYHTLVDFSTSYVIRDIRNVEGSRVEIEDSIFLESKVIANLLSRCEEVAVFVLTIGNLLEDMVAHLSESGLVLQATVLDAVGSGTAEQMAEALGEEIKEIAAERGMAASRRFSPGYCDWNVSQQEMVFRALRGNTAGVTLTEEYLMVPRKSVSGIIGIGSREDEITSYNPCRTCRKTECPGRRA